MSNTSQDQAAIAQGYLGLVSSRQRKGRNSRPALQNGGDGLEFWITTRSARSDKADDIKHRIGVVTGKDE